MDKILDRLGIYDLITVLIGGIIIVSISITMYPVFTGYNIFNHININNSIIYFSISFVIGMIFQELTSNLYKRFIFKGNKLLNLVFEGKSKFDYYITRKEIDKLRKLISNKVEKTIEYDNIFIYNMCKASILNSEQGVRANLDQAILGLSRSLSFYFIIVAFATIANIFINYRWYLILVLALSFFLSLLFYFRCKRFTKMRYSYILRSYLYNCLEKNNCVD